MSATAGESQGSAWKSDDTAALYNIGYDMGFAGLPLEHDAADEAAAASYRKGWEDGVAALRGDAPVVGENVRLLIWDLDDTFWRGTLEEGGIEVVPAHVEMVKTLSSRGIINSIASKNHAHRAIAVLEQAGVLEHFVLPQIAFQPKGELVQGLLELCQLRAPSVMFVDDNTINLNEVTHYNPGIQTCLPEFLPALLADPRFQGAPDPEHTRLQQYKVLEKRESERAAHVSDNTAFLRQSGIRVSIHHDIWPQFARIHDLINRTNQLNFTKQRVRPNLAQARAEMQRLVDHTYNVHAAYIKVADRYGYYGVCGFYLLADYKLQHFLFSCRALNMGVEQLIYQKLKRPYLVPVGEVVSDPAAAITPDWITLVDDAEADAAGQAPAMADGPAIVLRGACELQQAAHYLRERYTVIEELSYGNGAWGITAALSDYVGLRAASQDPAHAEIFDRPWFDPRVMDSSIFTASHDIYVLSFGSEPFVNRYRHKASGLVVPILLNAFDMDDLTALAYEKVSSDDLWLSEAQWNQMRADFEPAWRFDADSFERNLIATIEGLRGKRIVLVLACTQYGWPAIRAQSAAVNTVIERVAYGRPVSLVHMNDVVWSNGDIVELGHFRREVYRRLADALRVVLATEPATGPIGCGAMPPGLSSQKLALLGLFLAAKADPARPIVLPDLRTADHPDDAITDLDTVFSRDALQEFATRHGLQIAADVAADTVTQIDYAAHNAAHLAQAQRQGGLAPDGFACDFLRQLVPNLHRSALYQRLAGDVFTQCGITIVAHLRIDRNAAAAVESLIEKIQATLPDWQTGVLLCCDDALLPGGKETVRVDAMRQFNLELFWTSDFLSLAEIRDMAPLDRAILDFELALQAPIFIGAAASRFSDMAALEIYARTGAPAAAHFVHDLPGAQLARRGDDGAPPWPEYAIGEPVAPPPTVAPPPPEPADGNLLDGADTMSGANWVTLGHGAVSDSPIEGCIENAAVKCHRLLADTDYGNFFSFGCRSFKVVTAGDAYRLSASVWIPNSFDGEEVTLCFAGCSALDVQRARLNQTEQWQRISVTSIVPEGANSLFPTLAIKGIAGDEVHSTGWRMERVEKA